MGKREKSKDASALPLESEGISRKRKRHEKPETVTATAQDAEVQTNGEATATKKRKRDKKDKTMDSTVEDAAATVDGEAEMKKKQKKDKKEKKAAKYKDAPEPVNGVEAVTKKDKKAKKQKRKGDGQIEEAALLATERSETQANAEDGAGGDTAEQPPKPVAGEETTDKAQALSKEERKQAKKSKKKRKDVASEGPDGAAPEDGKTSTPNGTTSEAKQDDAAAPEDEAATAANDAEKKAHRFIVFIGNLPYTTTAASLKTHFASVHPTSVRHITQKPEEANSKGPKKSKSKSDTNEEEGPSKGYAFLEFDSYERMETCLRTFHHSTVGGRRINVELTAGGGGSSTARREKLAVKNTKLAEERHKRRLKEEEQRLNPDAGGKKSGIERKKHTALNGDAAGEEGADGADAMADVHPSRRGRVVGQ